MTCPDFRSHLDAGPPLAPEPLAHAAACPACHAELALAERLRNTLRDDLPAPCPDAVFEAALARIARLEADRTPIAPAGRRRPRWRVPAGGLLALIAAAGAVWLARPVEPAYSDAQIAEARQQVELAFALIGETGRDAGLYLHDTVLGEHVVAPMRRGLASE